MDVVAGAELTAAVSRARGFGILGGGYGEESWLRLEIATLSNSFPEDDRPFGCLASSGDTVLYETGKSHYEHIKAAAPSKPDSTLGVQKRRGWQRLSGQLYTYKATTCPNGASSKRELQAVLRLKSDPLSRAKLRHASPLSSS
jgi:hypothetical protein